MFSRCQKMSAPPLLHWPSTDTNSCQAPASPTGRHSAGQLRLLVDEGGMRKLRHAHSRGNQRELPPRAVCWERSFHTVHGGSVCVGVQRWHPCIDALQSKVSLVINVLWLSKGQSVTVFVSSLISDNLSQQFMSIRQTKNVSGLLGPHGAIYGVVIQKAYLCEHKYARGGFFQGVGGAETVRFETSSLPVNLAEVFCAKWWCDHLNLRHIPKFFSP